MTHLAIFLLSFQFFIIVAAYPHSRVVNGTSTDDFEFPFMVSIRNMRGMHDCGGTILNENTILTAGHCVCGYKKFYPTVQYGVRTTSIMGPTVVQISSIVCHENYTVYANDYAHNDIALAKVATPMIMDGKIARPVNLVQAEIDLETGAITKLLGWGLNATDGVVQTSLQKVDIEIISEEYCIFIYEGKIIESNICAGLMEGGKGQCNGDSGGPLLSGDFQVGIVSWSEKPCASVPYPGVFTKVSSFLGWIKKNI